jgi:hypothetical protein
MYIWRHGFAKLVCGDLMILALVILILLVGVVNVQLYVLYLKIPIPQTPLDPKEIMKPLIDAANASIVAANASVQAMSALSLHTDDRLSDVGTSITSAMDSQRESVESAIALASTVANLAKNAAISISPVVPPRRVEILHKSNKQWVHSYWVEEGDERVAEALDTPGMAIRDADDKVLMGRQR